MGVEPIKDRLTAFHDFEGRIHHRMKSSSVKSYDAFDLKLQA